MTPETPPRRELLLRSAAALPWLMWLAACGGGGGGTAEAPARAGRLVIDTDIVSILHLSGSTGRPEGAVLSHRNMVASAKSVASHLENRPSDTLVAARPPSFDAGFSQLTAEFHVGARVVLLNHLLPLDVLKALKREKVTGLTAVPPPCIQLTQLEWPAAIDAHLRYLADTSGRTPRETLDALRAPVPRARPFLRILATAPGGTDALDVAGLLAECEARMPACMVPQGVGPMAEPMPRNPNGKIDRKLLATAWHDRLETARVA